MLRLTILWIFGLLIAFSLVLSYLQKEIRFRLENSKTEVLIEIAKELSFSDLDRLLKERGGAITEDDAESLDFSENQSEGKLSYYFLRGGLMARVVHRQGEVISIELRKLEYE